MAERQFPELQFQLLVSGELSLIGTKSGTVNQPAAIDSHAAVLFVQQFVVHHEINQAGWDGWVVQADRDHDGVPAWLIMAEFSRRQCAVPVEFGPRHQSAKVASIHSLKALSRSWRVLAQSVQPAQRKIPFQKPVR